jgi:TonB family protein
MFRSVAIISICLAVSMAFGAQDADHDPTADAVAKAIMQSLQAKKTRCLEDLGMWKDFLITFCGRAHKSLRSNDGEIRSTIDGLLADSDSCAAGEHPWTKEDAIYERVCTVGSTRVTILLDRSSGKFVISYPRPLNECPELDVAPIPADLENLTNPVLIQESHILPEFPPSRLRGTSNAFVFLEAVIQKDGSVGQLCIKKAVPPEAGLEESAIEAVKQWKYEPATLEGEPINIRFTIFLSFSHENKRSSLSYD